VGQVERRGGAMFLAAPCPDLRLARVVLALVGDGNHSCEQVVGGEAVTPQVFNWRH
jgi:hypothetical protein